MKKQFKLFITAIIAITMCSALFAADGTRLPANGNWSDGASWVGGVVPGAGDTAYFTNDTAATVDTFIDVDTTIRNINVVDGDAIPNNYDIEPIEGKYLTLAGGTTIDNATRFNLLCVTKGTEGFTKIGVGLMNIGKTSNLISGTVNLNGPGQVLLNHNQALMNADVSVATLLTSRKNEFNAKTITVGNLGQLDMFQTDVPAEPGTIIADSITVNSGGLLGTGYDLGAPTVGIPIKLVSPSITVNAGGRIRIGNSMATGGSTALPGISGSNITVNAGGDVTFGNWGEINGVAWTISNPLILNGNGVEGLGALTCLATSDLTNNSPITLTGNTRIGQWGGGDVSIIMNGVVTGTGPLNLISQAGHATHIRRWELHAANTYSGNTVLEGFACQNITKLYDDQRLPNTELLLQTHNWGPMDTTNTFDLNGYTQAVTKLTVAAGLGGDGVMIVGGTGGKIYSSGIIDINGAYFDLDADIEALNQQFQVNSGVAMNLSKTVDVGPWGQLRPLWAGVAGGTTTVNINNGGKVVCYALRVADVNGTPIVNINAGGEVKCAEIYVGNATSLSGGQVNIDGGTLSDSDVTYVQTNWIYGFNGKDLTVDIKAGGATFDIGTQYRAVSEVITGVGDLTKTGVETLAFEVSPTLTGDININAGAVVFNCDVSGLAGNINLSPGAAIGGTGTLPGMTVPSGAIVTPGSSIGTLSFAGSVVMDTGSEYDWEVGDPVDADLLDVTGTFTIPGGGMDVNVIKAGSPGGTYTLVQTTGGIIGDPNDITMNYGILAGSPAYVSGLDLVADVVPEPATLGLLAILGLAFLRRK